MKKIITRFLIIANLINSNISGAKLPTPSAPPLPSHNKSNIAETAGIVGGSALFLAGYTTLLAAAIKHQNKKMIAKLIADAERQIKEKIAENSYSKNWKLIEFAIKRKDLEDLKHILNPNDPNINEKIDSYLFLPLLKEIKHHFTFTHIETPLIYAAQQNFNEGAQYLLENGANPNAQIKPLIEGNYHYKYGKINGYSALHFAVLEGNLELVKLLIKNDANPNIKSALFRTNYANWGKETPLHIAAQNTNKPEMYEIVKYLVKNGAQVNAKNAEGKTPSSLIKNKNSGQSKLIFEFLKKREAE